MLVALGWGLLAASSLIIGAGLGVLRDWNQRFIGLVLGFGAGALVASISFELAEEGFRVGGAVSVSVGLAVGAVTFFFADMGVARLGGRARQSAGSSLALGALLDGVPEQAVLGIGIAAGPAVSPALLLAIFVSNLPEAIGSANDMRTAGLREGPSCCSGRPSRRSARLPPSVAFSYRRLRVRSCKVVSTGSLRVRCWSCSWDR